MAELVPVRMGECRCVGAPHAGGDFAYLKPEADLALGLAANQVVAQAVESQQQNGSSLTSQQAFEMMQIKLGMSYAIHGIASWDRLDEHGKPLEINAATVGGVKWTDIEPVAQKAALLYADEVLRPLVDRLSGLSRSGQTDGSTSASKGSSKPRRKR